MANDYKNGILSPALAVKYGLSRQRVWQILQHFGFKRQVKRPDVDGEAIVAAVLNNSGLFGMADLCQHFGLNEQVIHKRVRGNPHWQEAVQLMALRRRQRSSNNLRSHLKSVYMEESSLLGRPLTVSEMRKHKIWANALQRIYGPNYVNKFRADLGEVPHATAEEG